MTNTDPIFVDFEASSLDLVVSYPIEVGICLPDGTTKSWLIKPHILWQDWSDKAASIHGISREELNDNGFEISRVVRELNELISGTVYCDAWTFDSFWLHRLFKTAKTKANFELDSVSSLLTPSQVEHWQDIHDEVIAELNLVRHRAENDAIILHETYKRLKNT